MTGALGKLARRAPGQAREKSERAKGGIGQQTHQKCTVFTPMGLSHMRLNQDCCASSVEALCHLRCPLRKPLRAFPWRVCGAARALQAGDRGWRKRGREAVMKLRVADMVLLFAR